MTAAAYSYNATEADYLNGTVGGTPASWTLGTPVASFLYGNDLSPQEGLTVGQILASAAGRGFVRRDLGVGNAFDLINNDLTWWFFYVKGKGDAILTDVPGTGEWPVSVRVYSAATPGTAWTEWDLAGNDTLIASWNFLVISGNNYSREGAGGGATLSAIRHIEFRFNFARATEGGFTTGDEPIGLDFIKYGNTITITGGTTPDAPADFAGLAAWSDGDPADRVNSPAQGLVIKEDVFNSVLAGINIGDGVAATRFSDQNQFYLVRKFSRLVPHNFRVQNLGVCTFGTKDVGSQRTYAINGCQLVVPEFTEDSLLNPIDPTTEINEAQYTTNFLMSAGGTANLYATKVFRFLTVDFGAPSTTVELIEADIDNNRNVDLGSGCTAINCKMHDPGPSTFAAIGAFVDDAGVFTNITADWNAPAGSTAIFPTTEAIGDGHVFGLASKSSRCTFAWATPGVGGAVTFQYWNGTAWSNLSNVVDGTNNFTQDGEVTWDVPTDWALRTILTLEGYYVRAVIDTVYTTNPLIEQGRFRLRVLGGFPSIPTLENLQVFNCDRGFEFEISGTVNEYIATDNVYDLLVNDTSSVNLIDSVFDQDKILVT